MAADGQVNLKICVFTLQKYDARTWRLKKFLQGWNKDKNNSSSLKFLQTPPPPPPPPHQKSNGPPLRTYSLSSVDLVFYDNQELLKEVKMSQDVSNYIVNKDNASLAFSQSLAFTVIHRASSTLLYIQHSSVSSP